MTAPRSLSDVRSSGVCWTRPFSFSDSSPSLLAAVVSPFPRSLRCFRGSLLSFAVLAGLLPQVATYDHSFTSIDLQATPTVHHHICSKPNFTKFKWLSILVANHSILYHVYISNCSISQPLEQTLPSLSDVGHACSPRGQLALDPNVRGTGYTYLHSPGDCDMVGVWFIVVFKPLLSRKIFSFFETFSVKLRLFLVFADRRATAQTTTFVEPCSIQIKKM